MAGKAAPVLSKADYRKMEAQVASLKISERDARERASRSDREAQQLRTKLSSANVVVSTLQKKLEAANKQAVSRAAAALSKVAEEVEVGVKDTDPRWMYETSENPKGQVFDNAAVAEAAQKATPGYWHSLPGEAVDAWFDEQNAPLVGPDPNDSQPKLTEATD